MRDKIKKLNAAQLKYIAIITMLIDHMAIILNGHVNFITNNYDLMRNIGRIAFPIFVFMLIEGFYKTSDVKRYSNNLSFFGVLSEIPYNYMKSGKFIDLEHQNIFFTLLLGLTMLRLIEKFKSKKAGFLYAIPLVIIFAIAADILRVSYGANGIFAVYFFYVAYDKSNIEKFLYYTLAFYFEFFSVVHIANFALAFMYNGERGKQNKLFFYTFYLLHIIILLIIRKIIL